MRNRLFYPSTSYMVPPSKRPNYAEDDKSIDPSMPHLRWCNHTCTCSAKITSILYKSTSACLPLPGISIAETNTYSAGISSIMRKTTPASLTLLGNSFTRAETRTVSRSPQDTPPKHRTFASLLPIPWSHHHLPPGQGSSLFLATSRYLWSPHIHPHDDAFPRKETCEIVAFDR